MNIVFYHISRFWRLYMFELCVLSQKFASTIENKDTSDLTYRTVLSSANISRKLSLFRFCPHFHLQY